MRINRKVAHAALGVVAALAVAVGVAAAPMGAFAAAPSSVDCGGASAADKALAAKFNKDKKFTGTLRGAMTGGRVACARVIVRVAKRKFDSKKAATVAVTTTIVESTIRNVAYGDGQSLGLYQQLPGWGSVQRRMDPTKSTTHFLDAMSHVANWRTKAVGTVCQDVQRSAYPAKYAVQAHDGALIVDALWASV